MAILSVSRQHQTHTGQLSSICTLTERSNYCRILLTQISGHANYQENEQLMKRPTHGAYKSRAFFRHCQNQGMEMKRVLRLIQNTFTDLLSKTDKCTNTTRQDKQEDVHIKDPSRQRTTNKSQISNPGFPKSTGRKLCGKISARIH